jgi:glycosyltransferase involved in cell wall biosynthesis
MKVSGFTFIRNAVKYDYPIVEAIQSILPLCDEVIVAVGASADETLALIEQIGNSKIKIIKTTWDDSLREGGRVLALETDKAYAEIAADADWCIYIQGDEVLPEWEIEKTRAAMLEHKDDKNVEGLLFKYQHFYGSYDYIGASRRWYRNEIRIVRKDEKIASYKDAQGFRKADKKLNVKAIDAYIHHYGWVKHPEIQQLKQQDFNKLWHSDHWVKENVADVDAFDYGVVDHLSHYASAHPQVMQARVARTNWYFSFDPTVRKTAFRYRMLEFVERYTGWRIGEYKNYRLKK